jgi:hypothetical protein
MKLKIGSILRSFIGQNRDAEDEVELHQTQMIEDDDIQTVEQQHIPGIQYNPPVGSRGFIARVGSAWRMMIGIFDLVGRITLSPGEIVLYSSSGGSVVAKAHLKTDGSIEITSPSNVKIINAGGDIIADSSVAAISLLNHYHQGNLGFPTGTPIMSGGGSAPASPPVANPDGSITDGLGINSKTHVHGGVTVGGSNTGQAS